jgi:hypothetical protein
MEGLTEVIPMFGGRVPILIEVPVAEGLDGPFLVSSPKSSFLWVNNKFPTGVVRAAVRIVPVGFLFRDAILQVARQAEDLGWGSVHPQDKAGLALAVEHVRSYGLEPVEVLYGRGFPEDLLPEDLSCMEAVWVPAGWAVVLPQTRAFVGTTVDFGDGQHALVLHNASRGIGLVVPKFPLEDHLTPQILKLLPEDCTTLQDLTGKTSQELMSRPGIGAATLRKIRDAMSRVGLVLRPEQ